MKLSAAILSATAIGLSAVQVANAQQTQPACSSVYTRKELLSLTASEWSLYKSILTAMQRDGWFAWFSYLHNTWFGSIHGQSQFFPFHRRFVYEWEKTGKRYNSAFAQPYWDEMRDYRTPASSQVLTSNWVGGNGQGTNRCVQNGLQAGWTMTYPNSHCFSRSFSNNGNPTSWYSPEYIESVIQRSADMTAFRPGIEYSLHGIVHLNMGGDMAQRYSPNDWIFMLHHANLDRLWWQWQSGHNHMWTMDGPNSDGNAISINSNIAYFNEPIRNVMQLGYGQMCFQYSSNPIRRRNLDASTTQKISAALPQDVLSEWFPDTAKSPAAAVATVDSAVAASGKPIPYPGTLTDDWISKQHLDRAAVRRVEADARSFVDAMKKAKYNSPH
ncbi:hypothetical protein H4R20_001889 [Coemansia guatemalensis]|uniref:Tyrosinase copper-binding domain-containing protein n=1 Tax=Coemansia guatemalensis TaxID=2761395 RepID=A0A9W8LSU1_9FUNG|nr:hypothetical protein H4R20_001889 [Coemansia guatemalensis]